jgi:hypothetical protein
MLFRIGVEGPLDFLPTILWCRAVINGNPLAGLVGSFQGGFKLLVQIAECVFVFGENEHAPVGPPRWLGRRPDARLGQTRTKMLANPGEEVADAGVREVA